MEAVGLLTGLLLIDAPVAIAGSALIGSVYGVLAITARRELHTNSHKIVEASTNQLKALQDGMGAIRDVLLDGSRTTYLRTCQQADRPQRQLTARNSYLIAFPRYVIETLGTIAIALLGGIIVAQRGSAESVIPLLGTFALGAQRLLPALQQVYSCWASLKSYNAAMFGVLEMLDQPILPLVSTTLPLNFQQCIRFESVNFRLASELHEVLRGLDLEIRRGERIGLVGSTGSGKTTMVDVLMGLLEPTGGKLLVDGLNVHDPNHPERIVSWRAAIAHVLQSIYLADSSIAENIVFGIPKHEIDMERVRAVAEQAHISGFIESIPGGYSSFAGERGIRLSGGQRQRIGIARSLCKMRRYWCLMRPPVP